MEWPYPEYYSNHSSLNELKQITKLNEPLNVITAMYISLYSTYHLINSILSKSNIYYQLLLILFVVNGISSSLAHMTNDPICIYIDGSINNVNYNKEPFFGFNIPESLGQIDAKILNPKNSWRNEDSYIDEATRLAKLFKDNFKNYGTEVEYLIKSGPIV